MNLLVITRSAWDDANSTGNTMSNFFSQFESSQIANLYFRSATPNNGVCSKYYTITDRDMIKSILNLRYRPGRSFEWKKSENQEYQISDGGRDEEKVYSYFRSKSSSFGLIAQDFLWTFGRWKNKKLDDFLAEFNPDIIFSPSFYTCYTHRVLWYLKEKTNAKIALFHADDYFSMHKSKLNYFDLLLQKKRSEAIVRSISYADLNFCISPKQKKEYESKLGVGMSLLFKGANFDSLPQNAFKQASEVVQINYIGSIFYGRWRTLGLLAKAIQKINSNKIRFHLNIYSQYNPTSEMLSNMVIEGCSSFNGKLKASEIFDVMEKGDMVLHIESFEESEKNATRLSFSTKIVDCFRSAKCILAIGWNEAASIEYLIENNAALIADSEEAIESALVKIQNNPNLIVQYGQKAWACGKRNHQIEFIQNQLFTKMNNVVRGIKDENSSN